MRQTRVAWEPDYDYDQRQDPRQRGMGHLNQSRDDMERVDRNSTRRRNTGGRNGTINATFNVDDRTVFSPITTIAEYKQDVGRTPIASALITGDGEKHWYFVDSSGRILDETLAQRIAESIQKQLTKGKDVQKRFTKAASTILHKKGVYSENSYFD